MKYYTLKQRYQDEIKKSQVLKAKVAEALGVSNRTVERYMEFNDRELARPEVIDVLRAELSLSEKIILIERTKEEKAA